MLSRSGRVGIRHGKAPRSTPPDRFVRSGGRRSHCGHVAADLITRRGSLVVRRGARESCRAPEARAAPPRADAEDPGLGSRDDVDVDGGLVVGGGDGRFVPLALDREVSRAGGRRGDPGRGSPRLGRARGGGHGRGVVPPLVLLAEIGRRGAFRRGRSGRPRRDRRGVSGRAAGRVRGPRGVLTPRGSSRRRSRGRRPRTGDHRRILVLLLGGFPVVEDRSSSGRPSSRAYPGRPRGSGRRVPSCG